jgi:hypothetical protein
MTTAISFYLGAFLFGAVLILTSLFFGGDEGDMDKDFDKDIDFDGDIDGDADGSMDGPAWLPFLSLRFWTFALGTFGMTGSILSFLEAEALSTALVSIFVGLFLGYFISLGFQKLKRSNVTVETSSETLKNLEGSVLLPIKEDGKGKIRVKANNQIIDLIAITQDTRPITRGQKVIIVSVSNGVANVTTLPNNHKNRAQKEIE